MTGAAPAVVVALRGVAKSFGPVEVLRDVALAVHAAENVVVLGRSGSGKSVLVKLVVGLLAPDRGEVEVFGANVHRLGRKGLNALRLRIGFSFQSGALYDSMSVRENLAFPLRLNHPELGAAEVRDRVAEALEAVGLPGTTGQMPSELSGGQRKRIGIARTLILRPEVMLYDEPTAGLDPITSGEINALVHAVRERYHTCAIVITHDLACARAVGDRVALLAEGRVAATGTFDAVFGSDDPLARGFRDYAATVCR